MSQIFFNSEILKAIFSQVYDTSKAWKIIDKRVSVPIIGQGAEAGQGASEYKVLRRCELYFALFLLFYTPPQRFICVRSAHDAVLATITRLV